MPHNKVSDYVAGHSTASTVFIGFTESSTCSFNNGMIVENRTYVCYNGNMKGWFYV